MQTVTKITKQERTDFMKKMLSANRNWAIRGLVRIYEYQTQEEQRTQDTKFVNGVGFNGVDAKFLSILAQQYLRKGYLSDKQMVWVFKKLPKYANQIVQISEINVLDSIILKNRPC